MSSVLMALGDHIFYVPQPEFDTPNFETLNVDSNFSIPSQPRLSREVAQQFTGAGEETVTIEGRLFPHVFGGLATLEGLRVSGYQGDPLKLIRFRPLSSSTETGGAGFAGDVLGKFFIKRVRQNHQKIGITGIAHKIDFTLELVKYGDDGNVADTVGGQTAIPDNSFGVRSPDGFNVEFT